MIEVLPTDQFFTDSPDAGHPACLCSRCRQPITEEDANRGCPIRVFVSKEDFRLRPIAEAEPDGVVFVGPDGSHYKVVSPFVEYRYHPRCLGFEEVAPVWSDEP